VVSIEVYEAQPGDWLGFKGVRLDALRDAPSAFRRVLEDEEGVPDEKWIGFLEGLAAEPNAGVLLAANGPDIVGIAMVGFDQKTSAVSIGGMWVRPCRGVSKWDEPWSSMPSTGVSSMVQGEPGSRSRLETSQQSSSTPQPDSHRPAKPNRFGKVRTSL
jgi:hypothetical protein